MVDWQPGDLALCVKAPSHCTLGLDNPCRPGGIYTVERVVMSSDGDLGLGFVGICFPHTKLNANAAVYYRRIPPHTPDAEDAETIRLLNGQPVREVA